MKLNLKAFFLIVSLFSSFVILGVTISEFKTKIQKYKEGKEVTRAMIIADYSTFKNNIDIELGKNALRVILGKTIDQLKSEEAAAAIEQKAKKRKAKAQARAQEEAKRLAMEDELRKALQVAQANAASAEGKTEEIQKNIAAAQKTADEQAQRTMLAELEKARGESQLRIQEAQAAAQKVIEGLEGQLGSIRAEAVGRAQEMAEAFAQEKAAGNALLNELRKAIDEVRQNAAQTEQALQEEKQRRIKDEAKRNALDEAQKKAAEENRKSKETEYLKAQEEAKKKVAGAEENAQKLKRELDEITNTVRSDAERRAQEKKVAQERETKLQKALDESKKKSQEAQDRLANHLKVQETANKEALEQMNKDVLEEKEEMKNKLDD